MWMKSFHANDILDEKKNTKMECVVDSHFSSPFSACCLLVSSAIFSLIFTAFSSS